MGNEAINDLVQADAALAKIEVSGENVFLMSFARKCLKNAFDKIASEKQEVTDDG